MRYIYGVKKYPAKIGNFPLKGIIEIINDRTTCDNYGRKVGQCYHSILIYYNKLSQKDIDTYNLDDLTFL